MTARFAQKARIFLLMCLISLPVQQEAFALGDVTNFNEVLIEMLPDGTIKQSLIEARQMNRLHAQPGYWVFGNKVCQAHARGVDKNRILADMAPSMSKELSEAIYEAALSALCPEHKNIVPKVQGISR